MKLSVTSMNYALMAKPSKFVATLNSGYFKFKTLEKCLNMFSAKLKTTCLHLKWYRNYICATILNNTSIILSINTFIQ